MHYVHTMQYAQRPKQSAPDTDVVPRLAPIPGATAYRAAAYEYEYPPKPMNKIAQICINTLQPITIKRKWQNREAKIDLKTVKGRESESAGSPRFSPILGL